MKAHLVDPYLKPYFPHWPLTLALLAFVFILALSSVPAPGAEAALAGAASAAAFALLLPINCGDPAVAAALLAAGACAARGGLAVRPVALDLLFFSLFLRLLRPRDRLRWRDAAALVALTALWANLHGAGAPLALWLVGLKAFKASLRTRALERAGYFVLFIVCVAAFSWNPDGYGLFRYAFTDIGADAARVPFVSLYGALLVAGFAACWRTLQQEFVTTLASATALALSIVLPDLRPLAALAACPVIALALGSVSCYTWLRR